MEAKRIAVYPGSFDPLTQGHIDIARRAARLVDRLVVAAIHNPGKTPLFRLDERLEILKATFADDPAIEVDAFSGLLVDYLARRECFIVIRGLRAISDFEVELQMALMNRSLSPTVETLFLVPSARYSFLSSSMVKQVYQSGGETPGLVTPLVDRRLKEKYRVGG
jgi:pantetheine-phosphate adenylyltransferase